MLALTVFTTDSAHTQVLKVNLAHITMFDGSCVTLHFIFGTDQLELIKVFIAQYVKFQCEGQRVILDMKEFQRVHLRVDSCE